MKQRCYDSNYFCFHRYGARGIVVCDRWIDSFANFLEDMGEVPEGMTLDRINNNGNYEPGNCRWATRKQQQRNRVGARMLTLNGKTLCMAEWAELIGVQPTALGNRLKAGWTVEKALTTPALNKGNDQ